MFWPLETRSPYAGLAGKRCIRTLLVEVALHLLNYFVVTIFEGSLNYPARGSH